MMITLPILHATFDDSRVHLRRRVSDLRLILPPEIC